ncbi:hypothetical protein [Myxococcus stipitatus]|uniref:hypothetical protein n=1 Tax=Myxococcus stipitatus TaxID=83455 RepID=UPI0030CB421A
MPTSPKNDPLIEANQAFLAEPRPESALQAFLEEHPELLPRTRLLNHGLQLNSIIRRFPLDASRKIDFVSLTRNSIRWEVVLMAVRRPDVELFIPGRIGRSHSIDKDTALREPWARCSTAVREFLTFDDMLRLYQSRAPVPRRVRRPNILSRGKDRYGFKVMHHEPFEFFSCLGAGQIRLSLAQKLRLTRAGYDIQAREEGRPLKAEGGRATGRGAPSVHSGMASTHSK